MEKKPKLKKSSKLILIGILLVIIPTLIRFAIDKIFIPEMTPVFSFPVSTGIVLIFIGLLSKQKLIKEID